MALPKVYKLGGVNVVDINGAPHYAGTQIPLKLNPQTGAPVQTYDLAGQRVFDVNGAPHYLQNDRPLQADQQGRPISYVAPKTTEQNTPPSTPASVYNAQERVKKYGVKKAEDMGMMEWAKANKELAAKVKPGQSGYDAIQFALGKTTVKPEDIRGYMDDTGRSAEDVRGILGKGTQVETVISKGNPDVTTIGPIPKVGGPEVEIPAGNFSEMSQSIQDLFAPRQETGATPFDFGFQNVMDQPFSQPFLMNFLKKVPGTK